MKPETIDKFLDECGITPGNWYVGFCNSEESCWCRKVGTDAKDEYGEELYLLPSGACRKDDAYVVAASREMLCVIIEEALEIDRFYVIGSLGEKRLKKIITIIETALPGRTWEEIKKRLEELSNAET